MQVKPEQLITRLEQDLPPAVWVAGDDPLLVQETCDSVREFARRQGFGEREVLDAGPGFDWNALLQAANNLSLFGDRKLLDLRLPSARLDSEAREALQAYVAQEGGENLLLITSPRLEKASLSTKWFKAVENRAHFVQVWPIQARQLPDWITRRLRRAGLSADPGAVRLLAERVEGNLLAAAQEVEKLSLLCGTSRLDEETVRMSVADSARFNVFSLIDSALAGDAARALKILYHLRAEGTEVLQVLHLLCRELRTLSRMREGMEKGENINGVMQAERVWKSRTRLVSRALQHHSTDSLERILADAAVVDQSVKGLLKNNPWDELAGLLLRVAGKETALTGVV